MSCRLQGRSNGYPSGSRRQHPGAKGAAHPKTARQCACACACVHLSWAARLRGRGSVTFQIYLRRRDGTGPSAYAVRIGGASCFQPWAGPERNKSSCIPDWPSRRHVRVGVEERGRGRGPGLAWTRSNAWVRCMGRGRVGGNAPARSPAGQGSRPPSGPLALIIVPIPHLHTLSARGGGTNVPAHAGRGSSQSELPKGPPAL